MAIKRSLVGEKKYKVVCINILHFDLAPTGFKIGIYIYMCVCTMSGLLLKGIAIYYFKLENIVLWQGDLLGHGHLFEKTYSSYLIVCSVFTKLFRN